MSEEKKHCTVCGKKLRTGTPFSTCAKCRTPEEQREVWRQQSKKSRNGGGTDDSVLSRMGFKTEADEAPPATKKPRKAAVSRVPSVSWQERFRSLAAALGLDPDGMLEGYCREWVETTRGRALAAPVKQLPSGVVEGQLAEQAEA